MKIYELLPGDQVVDPLGGPDATFVTRTSHPLYSELQLVIWKKGGKWFHDALSAAQDVGEVRQGDYDRREALRAALQPGPS